MRERSLKGATKVIVVTPTEGIIACNHPIPTENFRVKHERKDPVSKDYKQLAKSVEARVNKMRSLEQQNKDLTKRLNNAAMRNVGEMFNKLIRNSQ